MDYLVYCGLWLVLVLSQQNLPLLGWWLPIGVVSTGVGMTLLYGMVQCRPNTGDETFLDQGLRPDRTPKLPRRALVIGATGGDWLHVTGFT